MQTPYFSLPSLPWDRFAEDENRFRVIISATLVFFIVCSLVIANVELPEKQRIESEVVPPRVAKLVMEKKQPPPPPPPKVEEKKPELKPEPEPEKKVEKKPEPEKPKPEPKPEPKPKPQPKPKVTVKTQEQVQAERKQEAKQEAVKAAAVFDSLADLRDQTTDVTQSLSASQSAISANAASAPAATQRNLIGKMAAGGSGGVAVAKASSGGGGAGTVGGTGKLGKASATAVSSSIAKVADPVKQNAATAGASGKARRTSEQIQVTFDRYKSQIYTIYQRALREDPSLEGTLLLKLEIQPNGTVSACSVVSSELGNPDLERKIVVRVKQLNFGNANVEVWRGNFPIKFFPS